MILSCDDRDNGTVNFNIYGSLDCTDRPGTFTLSRENNTIIVYDYVEISLIDFDCNKNKPDCGLRFGLTKDCAWMDSNITYLNLSYPPDNCLAIDDSDTGDLDDSSNVFVDILPWEKVNAFADRSIMYKCCENDGSLLVYNYSNNNCKDSGDSDLNLFKIESKYNPICFDWVDRSGNSEIKNNDFDQGYNFIMDWTCGKYVDCDNLGQDVTVLDGKLNFFYVVNV